MVPVPISRLNIESSDATSGALTGSMAFRLRASLREGDAVFFASMGKSVSSRSISRSIFFLSLLRKKWSGALPGVEEALVNLPENTDLEKLPAHGAGFKSLWAGPTCEIRCQLGVEKMHDRLFGKLATTIRSKVLAGKHKI